MTKPNKTAIAEKLKAFAKWDKKRLTIEAARDLALDPHVTRFEKATAGIQQEAEDALAKITPEWTRLKAEIEADLLAGCDAETGEVLLQQVAVQVGKLTAIAIVMSKKLARVIDPQKYFSHTPASKRTKEFWAPVKILIAPATEVLGDLTVNKMADSGTKHAIEVKVSE